MPDKKDSTFFHKNNFVGTFLGHGQFNNANPYIFLVWNFRSAYRPNIFVEVVWYVNVLMFPCWDTGYTACESTINEKL